MRKQVVAVLLAVGLLAGLGISTASAGGRPLSADLSSANEVPDSGTGATGIAEITLNQGRGEVCVQVNGSGLAGAVVAGHIHIGEAGVNGPVAVNLGVNSADFSGCVDGVDKATIKKIRQNPAGYYVNIHTSAVPSGEIRGQLSK